MNLGTYLVTGGGGFIGSHLAEALKGNVLALDINFKYKPRNARLIKTSILNRNLFKILREYKPDVICHFAAVVGVKKYVDFPLDVLKTNIFGTYNMLECARKLDVEKFLLASTSEVYGKNPYLPWNENSCRFTGSQLRWCYAHSKSVDEYFVLAYEKTYGLKTVIIRYFNVYGPRQDCSDYGAVIPIFIRRVIQGKPPIVYGDGKQTRTFLYISDAVRGTISALRFEGVFNIGSEVEVTIEELAQMIMKIGGLKGKPVYASYKDFYGESYEDVRRRIPDTSKAQKILKFQPKIDLETGLKKTFKWFTKQI